MSDIITARDIEIITAEIKIIEKQVVKTAIYGCIEIGRRLTEAKEMVGHGGWGKYLEENVRYSQQWATNLMNLYKEYGDHQESLFDSFANSKSFGNIDVSKHILLLAVPAEERAEFAEKNDVENQSVKELQAALRERDKALAERDANLQEVARLKEENDRISADMAEATEKLDAKDGEAERLQQQIKDAQDKESGAKQALERLTKKYNKAVENEAKVKEELSKLKENPDVPESVMAQLRSEVAAEAAKKATEEMRKELEAAQAVAQEATKAREAAEASVLETQQKLAAAKKEVQMANPDMVLFSTYLTGAQEQFLKMLDALKRISAEDPNTGAKLRENAKTKLLDNLKRELDNV